MRSQARYANARPGRAIAPASAIRYFENGLQGHINLRGDPADARFAAAAEYGWVHATHESTGPRGHLASAENTVT